MSARRSVVVGSSSNTLRFKLEEPHELQTLYPTACVAAAERAAGTAAATQFASEPVSTGTCAYAETTLISKRLSAHADQPT